MKMTNIVCTYNCSQEELKYTLDSLINQKDIDFEIIIVDDGSKEAHEKFVSDYFSINKFTKYQHIVNKINQGTVKNILSGLQYAKGKYVHLIGAGDAISNDKVFSNVFNKMSTEHAEVLFVDMFIFRQDQPDQRLENISIPYNKKCYINGWSSKKTVENIIVFSDQISGASMFYETAYLMDLLSRIEGKVKYIEDVIQYLVLLDDKKIYYYDIVGVNYEYGNGISNNGSTSSNMRMKTDKNAFLQYLFENYSDNTYVKRRMKLETIEKEVSNKYKKGLLKMFNEPKWLYFRINRR